MVGEQNKRFRKKVLIGPMNKIKEAFGTLKLKKSTQEVMNEIDEGYD
ncbi:MAG TPA: hypothetical protein VJJ23_02030 [Candidatus Nanoarchaeia archaeon]|nr:hypothetical protein [Candidatus Nanoarchaeia archaeon]